MILLKNIVEYTTVCFLESIMSINIEEQPEILQFNRITWKNFTLFQQCNCVHFKRTKKTYETY